MFFRNLTFLRFPMASVGLFPLEEGLQACRLKPIGPLELSSRGFVSPFGRGEDALVATIHQSHWVTLGGVDRLLPPAVVNDMLARKLDEIEEKEGRVPSGRTRKRIKTDILMELIPKAFPVPVRVDAYLDLSRGVLAVDASSSRKAHGVVGELRRALGSFPALPLNAEMAPRTVLTGWLGGEPLPEGLSLGDECELKDAMDGGAVVKVQNEDLGGEEVRKHLEAGKQCTRLALKLDDHLAFVLGEDLVIRKLRFLDGAVDELENTEREDLRAELDARFALMTGEVGRLFDVLEKALKLSRLDEGQVKPASEPAPPEPSAAPSAASAKKPRKAAKTESADPLFDSAVQFVRTSGRASISALQRALKTGYNRAATLIEDLEKAGIVSPPDSGDRRDVVRQPKKRSAR
jgi:recombination associated protein RdgC